MAHEWVKVQASEINPGDRIRVRGDELTVSRIEPGFFGDPNRLAFIEDSEQRWYKRPAALSDEVERLA